MSTTKISVVTTVAAIPQKVWECWTLPEHITKWNFASTDWHCPSSENDLRVGGKMNSRMEARDGSFGFDFEATYDEVIVHKKIAYTMEDSRQAITLFEDHDGKTKVTTKDPKKILVPPGNSQAARQIRFTSVQEVTKLKSLVKSYIKEAIKIEKSGLKVELKKTKDYKVPEEFQKKLNQMPKLKAAYEALTPGRQRAYLHYFSQAKQAKTREQRVAKYLKQILSGKGLND